MFTAVVATLAGTVIAAVLACLPGVHIYNVIGLLLFAAIGAGEAGIDPLVTVPFLSGLIVGWSMINTIPAMLLGAPDESAIFTVMPGQKYLLNGRGYEGTMMTGVGGLGGLFFLVCFIGPLAPFLLPSIRAVMRPFTAAVIWLVIAFMLMSEWPKGGNTGPAGWRKFFSAWSTLSVGLLTFLISGLLGFILFYRAPVAVDSAFQNIMPAFVGLFAVPWCLLNMISGVDIPEQRRCTTLDCNSSIVVRSVFSGGLGGGFAAFFPVITGGVGGLLAGHATAQRDERVFLMSQGVSKLVYYTGAYLFFFVPGLGIKRGGAAWILQSVYTPRTMSDYLLVLGSIALAGGVSYLLLDPLTRAVLSLITRVNYRWISGFALIIILGLVFAVTGWIGLFIAAVATGIGLLPVLYGSRRLNCLGLLLLPIGCNMVGWGPHIAGWLGLL